MTSLGRGFLTGALDRSSLGAKDFRALDVALDPEAFAELDTVAGQVIGSRY